MTLELETAVGDIKIATPRAVGRPQDPVVVVQPTPHLQRRLPRQSGAFAAFYIGSVAVIRIRVRVDPGRATGYRVGHHHIIGRTAAHLVQVEQRFAKIQPIVGLGILIWCS